MVRALASFCLHVAVTLLIFHGLAGPMCACSPAPTPPPSTNALLLAAAVLERSDRMYSSVIGEGSTPPEVFAWRVIAVSGEADDLFRTVLQRGSLPGQLYALTWLRDRDPPAYQRAAAQLRRQGGEVEAQHGCLVFRAPIGVVLDEIERGEWVRDLWSEAARR